jgi:hypothetical protein
VTHFVYIYPQIFEYNGSSEQVQTDSTRSSLKPRVFLGRHFYFRCIFGKKKKKTYRTFTARAARAVVRWIYRTCGCAVRPPSPRTKIMFFLREKKFFLKKIQKIE